MLTRLTQPGRARKVAIAYLVSTGCVFLCWSLPAFRSGPCTPNLDFFSVAVWLLFTALLLLWGLVKLWNKLWRKILE